jgi:hypothetical protein
MIHNLYIGDSSDDEEKIQDIGEDKSELFQYQLTL